MELFDYLMFIDDDYATNYYHEVIVKEAGMVNELKYFMSTKEALEHFKELENAPDKKVPEVLFLDINLPEINGWEFLEAFKEIKLNKNPKIIMLSTSMNPKDKEMSESNELVFEFKDKPLTVEYLQTLKSRLN